MNDRLDLIPAALYARVSSDRQDVDLSVAAQLRALRDYAEKNGYLVAREYVDEAESGLIADRPQFRKMLDEAAKPEAPFKEILVWKFSRFTRKREHAVAFKSMLRRRGIRVVSITEHADDSPTGKLMEAIIESVDEFYSENLAQEVVRGMRESASRGFWVASRVPYGFSKLMVQDGAKKRPTLEPDPTTAPVVGAHIRHGRVRQGNPGHHPHPQRRGRRQSHRQALVQERRPHHPEERGLHGNSGLGRRRQGQGGAGAGGEGLPRHRLQGPVPPCEPEAALPRTQEVSSPQGGEHLPPQRTGQMQGVQPSALRPGRQEREVRLLRLPVHHEAGQRGLRRPQAQRPALRGAGGGEDSGERAHRVQHPGVGEAGGRGDGRHRPRAAP